MITPSAPAERIRIAVLGYIVRGPLGGLAWHHLQYVAGLAQMGHDVWFIEDSDDYPGCYDPCGSGALSTDATYGLAFAAAAFARLGLADRWAYFDAHTGTWHGGAAAVAAEMLRTSDLLLNLSGMNPLRVWSAQVARRVLVDTDPVFTQVRHLQEPAAHALAAAHTHFATFGENIFTPGCTIPDDGFAWVPTRQPVVPALWPVTPGDPGAPCTTVMQWESYRAREHAGVRYGMKAESFAPYRTLPSATSERLQLALGGASAPRDELRSDGWELVDSREPTRDPWRYQEYLRASKAEFGVAKHGYVVTRSGWFSERTAAYLASGRPVVVQETGFTDWMGTCDGVAAFSSPAEAVEGLARIARDYAHQCRAAREVVMTYFDARMVLAALLAHASTTPVRHRDALP